MLGAYHWLAPSRHTPVPMKPRTRRFVDLRPFSVTVCLILAIPQASAQRAPGPAPDAVTLARYDKNRFFWKV